MKNHPFDLALELRAQGAPAEGRYQGASSAHYWNMVGPYGGITAATVMKAVMQHPDRLGEPVALTVNYVAALTLQPFTLVARIARTNRSTQHWTVEVTQVDDQGQPGVVVTATVLTAVRRLTWRQIDHPMPVTPPPEQVPLAKLVAGVAWLDRYEMRIVEGALPQIWDGTGEHSRTLLWMRDRHSVTCEKLQVSDSHHSPSSRAAAVNSSRKMTSSSTPRAQWADSSARASPPSPSQPGWIAAAQLEALARPMLKNGYGQYLLKVINDKIF